MLEVGGCCGRSFMGPSSQIVSASQITSTGDHVLV